jgi:hypothetical protein
MPFIKGDTRINRNGRPKNAEIDMLRHELEREGKKRRTSFWHVVAHKAFTNPQIMLAVLKKFVPDLNHQQVDGLVSKETSIIIIKANGEKIESGNNPQASARALPVK